MLTRLILFGFISLAFFTSCVKQPYLLSAGTGSYGQKEKNVPETVSIPETRIQAQPQLSASVSITPEVSAVNENVPAGSFTNPLPKPAKTLFPDTLKPDTLKTKPAETKTQPVKKPVTAKPKKELPQKKNQWVALALVVLAGVFGAHRFYLGHYVSASAQLGITVLYWLSLLAAGGISGPGLILLLIAWIWNLVDLILVATGKLKPYRAEYKVKF